MKLFDVLDKDRNKLGYTKYRNEVLESNEYSVGVEIWIFNNKKLLMTQRSINKSHFFKWEVPGGCAKTGETSLNTLVRELKEEIGISINNFKIIDTLIYKQQFVDVYMSDDIINLDDVVLQKNEVCNIKFVTKDEFLKMAKNNEIVESVYNRYKVIKDKFKKEW